MNQINRNLYRVANGEVVNVKLVPTNIGDRAVFTTAPVDSQQISPSPREYQFTAQGNPKDTIFGAVTCDFTGADNGASFFVIVSSPGSGPFDGPTISKDDPDSEEPVSVDFKLP
ncbi:MAG: hypothetical protein JWM21_2893 [Acidobacteria bacterium]|nr:hypothetical protein [Acidobacteriota bacterium]